MPALQVDDIVDIMEGLEARPLLVAPEHCARQRHRRSTCTLCVDVCPSGAMTWNDGPEIDWDVCTGCGICAAVCPTAALEAGAPSNDELLVKIQRTAANTGVVALACPRAQPDPAGATPAVTVSCLGRLDEGLLVSAIAGGAQALWLVDGACGGCPQAAGRDVAEAMVARTNAILEAFGARVRAEFRAEVPAAGQPGKGANGSGDGVSRRGMFKVLARETARVSEVTAKTVHDNRQPPEIAAGRTGDLPKALPSRRLLLLAALKQLGAPVNDVLTCDGAGSFSHFELAEGCTACHMCAYFCPSGALSKVVEGNRVGLAYRQSHCVSCGLCRDTCYRDAVILSPRVELSKILSMAVDWCFVDVGDAEPWKHETGDRAARQILGVLGG